MLSDHKFMLMLVGFVLFALAVFPAAHDPHRYLLSLVILPNSFFVMAVGLREKYTGPLPKGSSKDDERKAHEARANRYWLFWGGVYAAGEILAVLHFLCVRLEWPASAEAPVLIVALCPSLWLIREMFQRESQR